MEKQTLAFHRFQFEKNFKMCMENWNGFTHTQTERELEGERRGESECEWVHMNIHFDWCFDNNRIILKCKFRKEGREREREIEREGERSAHIWSVFCFTANGIWHQFRFYCCCCCCANQTVSPEYAICNMPVHVYACICMHNAAIKSNAEL